MREYELTIYTPVGQDKLPIELGIYKYAKIKRSSVEMRPGKRIPYAIRAHEFVDDWFMEVKVEDARVATLAGMLNMRDDVLRYLLVRKAPRTNNNN